jgi:hypothetical protein
MDSIATTAATPAATLASSQITEAYNWSGRQRAQFQADMDQQARATGSDSVQLGFKDLLDLVNPLQHIPVVSDIYQAATGDDTIKPAVKTTGDIIYGGPIGGLTSVFNTIFKQASGNDAATTVANWLGIGGDEAVQTAAAATTPATTTASAPAAQASKPNILNLAASPTGAASATNVMQTAAANPPAPDSPLFDHLKKGAAPQGQVFTGNGNGQPKFFNPTATQYAGVKPASFAAAATAAPTQNAAIASNAAIAGTGANAAAQNPAPAPQSEFAQKMLAAMDRYEAAKKAGDVADAPAAVSTGL